MVSLTFDLKKICPLHESLYQAWDTGVYKWEHKVSHLKVDLNLIFQNVLDSSVLTVLMNVLAL